MRAIVLLVVFAAALVLCEPDRSYTQTQNWFEEQRLDHSDPSNQQIWSQRYWVVEDFFVPNNGAVLLYICGEYTCPGVNPSRLFVIDLAKRYNALILVLEHRYYGDSMPYGEDSLLLQNLKQLNVHQALDDLAFFLNWVKSTNQFGVTTKNPWFTVGGSYPGALSAWFRYKYPHLTVGALASSAVVNSKVDYPEFDGQIYSSTQKSSDECTRNIQQITRRAEEYLADEKASLEFRKQFNSENLNEGEFLFMFADVFVELVQYGRRTWLCEQLHGKTAEEGLQWTADFVQSDVDVREYGSFYLRNTTHDVNHGSRSWTYQYCSEVGWLQTAPKDTSKSMRSQKLTIDFYKQFCKDSFGVDLWPNTDVFNAYFGGEDLNVPGLIMTNGDEDPWKHVSVLRRKPGQMQIIQEIVCDNCAHCVELYTPSENDSLALQQTRKMIVDHFDRWIARHWHSINGDGAIILQ